MTTFTTDDREEAYKKIVEAAPNQPGYEDAVPIPFTGTVSKELTDQEILDIWYAMEDGSNEWTRYVAFARAILKKARK
jgi:hypothetical protein